MPRLAPRPVAAAGVALVGSGLIAAAPVTPPLPDTHPFDIRLTATDMILDLVRHGQSTDNVSNILGTTPPGAPLTDTGEQQAITVGNALYDNGHNDIDGVYASDFLRTQQTAWPLYQLLAGHPDAADHIPSAFPDGSTTLLDPSHVLSGLDEVNAGFLNGQEGTAAELAYLIAPLMWITGNYWFPMLGSTVNPNGMAFEDNFTGAVQQIYDNGGTAGADGDLHDVAFTHDMAISAWTLMNVKNPDFGLVLDGLANNHELLPNTGQVVVEGNPTDGWTLVSWDGHDVPATPDLLTGLFVDWRDLITAPQMAFYHIWEAIQGGDPTDISTAVQTGFDQVLGALEQFPQAVIDTISDSTGTAGSAAGDSGIEGLLGLL